MSHCEEGTSGRHKAIFLTPEDADPKTSKEQVPEDLPTDAPPGLILEDGSINWNCPCLGGMPVGPCGVEFRSAFECFHYSTAETKGSDCLERFSEMQECMKKFPDLYDEKDKVQEEAAKELGEAETNNSQKNEAQGQ